MKNYLKLLLLFTILIFSVGVHAQEEIEATNIFLRVYGLEGKKINKGLFVSSDNSTLTLKFSNEKIIINVKEIGYIKTKRSVGHNILIGSSSGAALGVFLGVTTGSAGSDPNDPIATALDYSRVEGGLILGGLGLIGGAGVGGVTALFKNSKTYIIDGNVINWDKFLQIIENK